MRLSRRTNRMKYLAKIKLFSQNHISLVDILFGLYIFSQTCIYTSWVNNATLVLFVVVEMLSRRKIRINGYFILEVLFIVYHMIHIGFDITVMTDVAYDDLTRVISVLIVNVIYINYHQEKNNIDQILSVYLFALFAAYLLLLYAYANSFSTRTGEVDLESAVTVFGVIISGGVSTKVGMGAAVGFFFAFVRYYKRSNLKLIALSVLFAVEALFSGTRKVLILMVATMILVPVFKERRITKQIRNIIIAIVLIILAYFIAKQIPVINDTIIHRLEKLMTFIDTGKGDSSSTVRLMLMNKAEGAMAERPWFGWGLENFRHVFDMGRYHCHNNFYEMLVAGGIVGFIIFYLKYVLIFIQYIRTKFYLKKEKNLYNKFKGRFSRIKENELDVFYSRCFLLLFILMVIMEYWQRTYNQRSMAIIYAMIYAVLLGNRKKAKARIDETLHKIRIWKYGITVEADEMDAPEEKESQAG